VTVLVQEGVPHRQPMPVLSTAGQMVAPRRWCHKALTGAELENKDARRQRLSPHGVKAGDRIRTDDVQLGKLAFYH
jgi:hypothetical protein